MLCGNFVGCALRRGAIVPHMINWKDSRIYDIPPGLDIPGRRVSCFFSESNFYKVTSI
jgi:hypothetical protein